MYCRNCNYDLQQLPGTRCPECGRPFDPSDERSFRRFIPLPRPFARAIPLAIIALFVGPWIFLLWEDTPLIVGGPLGFICIAIRPHGWYPSFIFGWMGASAWVICIVGGWLWICEAANRRGRKAFWLACTALGVWMTIGTCFELTLLTSGG